MSYAHVDDEAEGGRIRRLAKKIQAEYQLLTGDELEVFVDREDIRWGQQWQERIDASLQETTFFIPVLTNSYFASPACRKEFLDFHNWAKSLGVSQYLLAIRYGPVRDLRAESTDAAKAIAAATQFKSWEALRLLDEESADHRTAVNDLALELERLTEVIGAKPASVAIGRGGDETDASLPPEPSAPDASNTGPTDLGGTAQGSGALPKASPGTVGEQTAIPKGQVVIVDDDDPYGDEPSPLELAAELEPRMKEWNQILVDFLPILNRFNELVARGADRARDSDGPNVFAQRILILRETAEQLEPVSLELEAQGHAYMEALLALDPAYKALFEMVRSNDELSQDDRQALEEAAVSVTEMAATADVAKGQMTTAIDSGRNLARASRDLRPAIKRFETGVRNVIDGQSILDGWAEALNDLVIERAS